MEYEIKHLLKKLKNRDIIKYAELIKTETFETHPMFELIDGDIEEWEKFL